MARIIPPAQQQQMSQQLAAMTQTLQNMSAGIRAAAPAATAPAPAASIRIPGGATLSGLAQQHGTTVSELMRVNPQITNPDRIFAGAGLTLPTAQAARATTTPAIPATPQRVPDAPPPTPTAAQMQEERMRALMREHEAALRTPPPQPVGLQPQERQLFTDERANLRARYDAALQTLRRQQEQDRQRLIGRYAVMGFGEPGAVAGPMAGEPGIKTRALQETGEVHARNIAGLEQAGAEDVLAITRAEQEAERRGRIEEAEQFARRQDALIRNLERQIEMARPEEFTLGGRMFQRDRATGAVADITPHIPAEPEVFTLGGRRFQVDPATGTTRDITPPEALQQQVNIERDGRRWRVTLDERGREIGAIDLGPVTGAGGEDPILSSSQALAHDVPYGTTEGQLKDIYESLTPPQWFVEARQREAATRNTMYIPSKLQELWNAERRRVTKGSVFIPGQETAQVTQPAPRTWLQQFLGIVPRNQPATPQTPAPTGNWSDTPNF